MVHHFSIFCLLCLPLSAQIHVSACTPSDFGFTGGDCFKAGVTLPAGAPPYLGQERGGDFSYHFPLADGQYAVVLHFIENSVAITGPGQRIFSVSINGSSFLSNFDLAVPGPLNTPVDRTLTVTATGGTGITITFSTIVRRAVVSDIDITPVAAAPANPFPGCQSDGAGGIACAGTIQWDSTGVFDPTITWGGVTYRLPPPGDGTGKALHDSGVVPCGNIAPTALSKGPTCHQIVCM